MTDHPDQNREVHHNETTLILPEEPPHVLLSQALYWLKYYTEQSSDLGPVEAVQDILKRLLVLLPESSTTMESDETSILNREFEVSVLTRLDLLKAGFSKEIALSLTDEEMKQIAKSMGDTHTDNGYWEDLTDATNRLIEERAEQTKSTD